ncbi:MULTISPECIES: hypothetical protein [unclassified Streptomyces]|uniref:hypothetical protein n=1 Tax=unclassified Streptomyces TaxID=2593676 RepID=UPI0036BB8B6A
MSAREERHAPLTAPTALYDQARHLLGGSAGGIPPWRGYGLPRRTATGARPLSGEEAWSGVREAFSPLPGDAATLQRRFARLGIEARHRHLVRSVVAELPLPAGERDAARTLGRRLVRTAATVPAVTAGIALLGRLGTLEDVACLRVLAVFRDLTGMAVDALDLLDRRSAAVVWLAVRARRDELQPLVHALWAGDRRAVRAELVSLPASPRFVNSAVARRIAEACQLSDLLDGDPDDTRLLARAGGLLVRMGQSRGDVSDLLAYRDGLRVYELVVSRAGRLPPTLDNAAMLLSLALDLSSGIGVLLDWPPGLRAALLEALGRLLAEPRWVSAGATAGDAEQRRRGDWIRRTGRQPFRSPAASGGFRIEVVAGDPAHRAPVEARVLIDGRPVVPALFGRGPAHSPEYLLDDGRLRAGEEPREVQLAEANCTEGCCGALYVTIRRDAHQVVWENWRQTLPGSREPAPALPACRFEAAAYEAEIARAATDCSWSWRTRAVARLIKAGLVENPDLLSRWDAGRGWIGSGCDDPGTAVVTFWYVPGLASGRPERADRPLQFRWVITDDGTAPESQAAAALRRLAHEDPKSYARVCGGSRERAEELGFAWPDSL